MNLFIDTTTKFVSIITFDKNGLNQIFQYEGSNDHTTTIYSRLNQIELNQIDKVYVTAGPGSYTGVRIGVLVAKTLAHELEAELYAINTLELFYNGLKTNVVLDARGKKYFRFDGNQYSIVSEDEMKGERLINGYVDSNWLLAEDILKKFVKVDPINLQIDYMKDAI